MRGQRQTSDVSCSDWRRVTEGGGHWSLCHHVSLLLPSLAVLLPVPLHPLCCQSSWAAWTQQQRQRREQWWAQRPSAGCSREFQRVWRVCFAAAAWCACAAALARRLILAV